MKALSSLFLVLILLFSTMAFAGKNNFQFQISEYHTKRQAGQTLDLNVRYTVADKGKDTEYPDYIVLRNTALKYLEPSIDLPVNTFWEIIVANLAEELKQTYHLTGVSVQAIVYPNPNGEIPEPGFHGPIYTTGDVIPFVQVVLPNTNVKKSISEDTTQKAKLNHQ